ncbi:MAG: 30S ribosomal protein S6 [Planctomycetota bacterium]|jgi:small subunit ribosomal protein S6
MSDDRKTYEAMFLLDAALGDFETASEPIRTILSRSEANLLSMQPWDDRRLAYDIQGRKRGLYVLTYFDLDPVRVAEIEHDCQLDEHVLRVLILQKDHISPEQIGAETPAMAASKRAAKAAEKQDTEAAEVHDKQDKAAVESKSESAAPAEESAAPQEQTPDEADTTAEKVQIETETEAPSEPEEK